VSEPTELAEHLDRALAELIPESVGWVRRQVPLAAEAERPSERWIDVPAPAGRAGQRLGIGVRDVGDVEVHVHVPDKSGSPFEQLFVGRDADAAELVGEVAGFVRDLLEERLVLAWDGRLFRGGRRFLPPSALSARVRRSLRWVFSWKGTHDWTAR
jgi:hypothetical protein